VSRLGPYEIHHRVAAGGMAELFLASEQRPDGTRAPVAIKRIRPEAASDQKLVKMLIDEGRVTRHLAHPGIARTLHTVKSHDVFYLVMEYVDGRDLRSVLKRLIALDKRLPAALGALIALRTAEALDHAHRAATEDGRHLQIVHRDLNPTNLMISYAGEVRVIDFGIARAADRLTATRAGVVKGKLRYMAPEQASGAQIDHRADLYALGLVLYEMIAGQMPLHNLSDMEFVRVMLRGQIPPLRQLKLVPSVPPELDAVVEKALQTDRRQRYAWGSEMAQDIDRWYSTLARPPRAADLALVMNKLFPGETERLQQQLQEELSLTLG
jgi:serine/threonine protein kinase